MRKSHKEITTVSFYENSFGRVSEPTKVKMDVSIYIDGEHAGFEIYDVESGGDEFYAEGMLEIVDNVLYGYDGIFELPDYLLEMLEDMNVNVDEI